MFECNGQVCKDKKGNINNKRIWSFKSLHVYVCSEHFIPGKFILIDIQNYFYVSELLVNIVY